MQKESNAQKLFSLAMPQTLIDHCKVVAQAENVSIAEFIKSCIRKQLQENIGNGGKNGGSHS